MKRSSYLTSLLFLIQFQLYAQDYSIQLWPDGVPNQRITYEQEINTYGDIDWVKNVQNPCLDIYLPTLLHRTKQVVVICPGGGYSGLAYDWEGEDIAKWFNSIGVTACVLKYRLPNSPSLITAHDAPLQDAQRAIQIVRSMDSLWHIDRHQVGVMGFSAGGHLASTLTVHYDAHIDTSPKDTISARPDFAILIYPVITMDSAYTHMGSRNNLIGLNPSDQLVQYYSNEKHVDSETPPTFLVHSGDDLAVPVMNSLLFYEALQRFKVPTEMHIYPYGGHGYSLAIGKGHLATWPDRLAAWLESLR